LHKEPSPEGHGGRMCKRQLQRTPFVTRPV